METEDETLDGLNVLHEKSIIAYRISIYLDLFQSTPIVFTAKLRVNLATKPSGIKIDPLLR